MDSGGGANSDTVINSGTSLAAKKQTESLLSNLAMRSSQSIILALGILNLAL